MLKSKNLRHLAASLGLLLCCLSHSSAQPDPNTNYTAESLAFDRARLVFDSGKHKEAMPLFRAFLEQYPNAAQRQAIHYYLGVGYFDQFQFDEARTELEFLRQAGADCPDYARGNGLYYLAQVYEKQKDWQNLAALREEVIAKLPGSAHVRRVVDWEYQALRKTDPDAADAMLVDLLKREALPSDYEGKAMGWHLQYLSTRNPTQCEEEFEALWPKLQAASAKGDLPYLTNLSALTYEALMRIQADRQTERLYHLVRSTLARYPNEGSLAQRDLAAYADSLEAGNYDRLFGMQLTAEAKARRHGLYRDTWREDPALMIDRAQLLVQKRLMREGEVSEWYDAYAALLRRLPTGHPARATGLLLQGQWAEHRLYAGRPDGAVPEEAAQAVEEAYRDLAQEYPKAPGALTALAGLVRLYRFQHKPVEAEASVRRIEALEIIDAQVWVHQYGMSLQSEAGYTQALAALQRLQRLASASDARQPVWALARARCQEGLGRAVDAERGYLAVVSAYPKTSFAVIAQQRADAMRGGVR